jgi:hypothetical protein
MTNHTTDTEAEASAAAEIQMMEEVSNSNNANTKRRLGIPSFSSLFNGLIIGGFTVMAVTFIIAVLASAKAADRVTMMASQQKAAGSAKSTKAPKAGKSGGDGGGGCLWPLETILCSKEEPTADQIIFNVCPTKEAEGQAVGEFLSLSQPIEINIFVYETRFTGDDIFWSSQLLDDGVVYFAFGPGQFVYYSAASCPTTTVPPA